MADPVPQPVVKNAFVTGLVLQTLASVALLTNHFGWWNPSADDLLVIAEFAGFLGGVAVMVQGWFVHNRVTPNDNVALTVAEAKALNAGKPLPPPVRVAVAKRKHTRKATSPT